MQRCQVSDENLDTMSGYTSACAAMLFTHGEEAVVDVLGMSHASTLRGYSPERPCIFASRWSLLRDEDSVCDAMNE